MKKSLIFALVLVLASSVMAADYDPSKIQAGGCYGELAEVPEFLGNGQWEYVVDIFTNGGGSQDYAVWGFDNAQIANMWNTKVRQVWNGGDAWIESADNYSPSIGDMDAYAPDGGDLVIEGGETWSANPSNPPFGYINEWHAPNEYAKGLGAFTGLYYDRPEIGPYWKPAMDWSTKMDLYDHYDAGETYNGYISAVAGEDMMYFANANAVWGHGEGVMFTVRIVTTEELQEGDLTWSMPSYGNGHETGGLFDVLWATAGDDGRLGDFDDDGDIDADDIDALGAAVTAGSTDLTFDMDGDGDVDSDDFTMHVTTLVDTALGEGTGTAFGDFNLDGLVGILDLGLLGDGYNSTNGWANGDANGDGTVGILDLGLLGDNYGYDGSVVPEPATLSLLALGGVALMRRRSR